MYWMISGLPHYVGWLPIIILLRGGGHLNLSSFVNQIMYLGYYWYCFEQSRICIEDFQV